MKGIYLTIIILLFPSMSNRFWNIKMLRLVLEENGVFS